MATNEIQIKQVLLRLDDFTRLARYRAAVEKTLIAHENDPEKALACPTCSTGLLELLFQFVQHDSLQAPPSLGEAHVKH